MRATPSGSPRNGVFPSAEDVAKYACCDVVNRGVALYQDKVYLATLDMHVVALNAKSGKVVWDKTLADYKDAYTFTVAPLVARGKVYVGTSNGEYPIRGFIEALDATSGNSVWRTYTVPTPGEPGNETWGGESWKYGGGSAWVTGAYDPQNNTLYWGTGNPAPDWDGEARPGDNLYTNSTLALDPYRQDQVPLPVHATRCVGLQWCERADLDHRARRALLGREDHQLPARIRQDSRDERRFGRHRLGSENALASDERNACHRW
ncbi:MAG: PQQ-binding-like beta-propeller repeat protein [Burkholderiales bacterium]